MFGSAVNEQLTSVGSGMVDDSTGARVTRHGPREAMPTVVLFLLARQPVGPTRSRISWWREILRVSWPPGFAAGTYDEAVVRDPAGLVVARDGQRLVAPAHGFPRLPGGWAVCFGETLQVQEHPPP